MPRGALLAAIAIAAIAVFPATRAIRAHAAAPRSEPAATRASTARLIDQTGRAFTLAQLRGAPLIVTFVSAHCHDACPLIDAQTAAAVANARAQRLHVRFVTITLDPAHDSPSDMRALAHLFHAKPKTWIVAGGAPAQVRTVMNAFHVVAQRGRNGYADVHSTFVYVVDAHGVLRQTMLASTDMSDQIVSEVRSNWVTLTQ